jgi:hypothetical protein
VDLLTLKALLAVPLTEIEHADYLFCRSVDCPTVYFSAGGEQAFTESSLRERVYQKHPEDDDVFVCYCFRHTAGSVRAGRADSGRDGVIEAIRAGIQRGLCACEIRNPQGSCCLGNVQALLSPSSSARPASVTPRLLGLDSLLRLPRVKPGR